MKTKTLELIDFKKVDTLLEGFSKATGFVTAILDLEGNVLSKSGWRQICTNYHRIHPETSQNCRISDTKLANKMAVDKDYQTYQCLNGLVDVAVPIVIKGDHIANLFTGQIFLEEPDRAFFKKRAKMYGFDEEKYMEALDDIPVVSREEIHLAMDFLLNMTQLISEMTFNKLEQTELYNAVTESELQYRNLANAGLALIWKTGPDKLCYYFNDPWLKFTGRTLEQEMGNGWTEGVHPDDRSRCMETFVTGFNKREPFDMEYRLRHASGEYRVILDLGTPNYNSKGAFTGYIGHCFDITKRKQTEEALRESEEMMRSSQSVAHICSYSTNIIENKLNKSDWVCSPEFYKIFGIDKTYPHTIEGWIGFIHPDHRDEMVAYHASVVKERKTFNHDYKIIRINDGAERWVHGTGKLEFDKKGNPIRMHGAIQDITERKRTEKLILKLNEELEQRVIERTSQLEASNKELEAFSYSVSHDLRAPLRHINGYVDLLNDKFRNDLPEKAQYYLTTVTDAARQMGKLIDELLRFSRTGRQELRKVEIDMNTLVKEVIERMMPDIEEREINWEIHDLPQVFGDSSLLKQVWMNLLDNALKYSKKRKKTEISIGFKEEEKDFVFYVRDNGVGFNMKYAHKLFGVFQRLHSQTEFEGTGIGLANVQRIIHKHKGRVWAKAETGKGATFFFSLQKTENSYYE